MLFYFGFACFLFGLPISKIILSVSQFIMAAAWLLEANYKQRILAALKNKFFIAFAIIYLIHLLGLAYTENWIYAFKDIRIKLPLVIVPFIYAGFKEPDRQIKKYLLYSFIGGLVISGLITLVVFLGLTNHTVQDVRKLNPLLSHIRFSILLVIGFIVLVYQYINTKQKGYLFISLFFLIILFLIKSLTGWFLLFLAALFSLTKLSVKLRYSILFFLIVIGTGITIYLIKFYKSHFTLNDIHLNKTETNTPLLSNEIENGNYVWQNVKENELKKQWELRSTVPYNGYDRLKQPIRNTLVRYLTSKNLSKDSAGISQLTIYDIYNIENGFPNYRYTNPISLDYKLYQLMYEVHLFLNGIIADKQSLTLRIVYAKIGLLIWKENLWMGVGTGDVQDAFNWKYEYFNLPLSSQCRLRAHNQFITFGLSFGILGFLIIVSLLFSLYRNTTFVFRLVYSLLLLSFLNEDTLESQVGVSMFVGVILFFYWFCNTKNQTT